MAAVVKSLEPTISYALVQSGSHADPYMKLQAKNIAAKAIKSYDPSKGAGLPTWVTQQLMQLRRIKRTSQATVRLPEQVQLDAFRINKATLDFVDQHGREPDLLELSDAVAMPVKRIEHVRKFSVPTVSESAFQDAGASAAPAFDAEALDYVYREADATDRKIIEMRMGYGGRYTTPLDKKTIATKLKLHPAQVTRRTARLARRIQQLHQDIVDIS